MMFIVNSSFFRPRLYSVEPIGGMSAQEIFIIVQELVAKQIIEKTRNYASFNSISTPQKLVNIRLQPVKNYVFDFVNFGVRIVRASFFKNPRKHRKQKIITFSTIDECYVIILSNRNLNLRHVPTNRDGQLQKVGFVDFENRWLSWFTFENPVFRHLINSLNFWLATC